MLWGNIYFQPPIFLVTSWPLLLTISLRKTLIAGQRQWNKKLTQGRIQFDGVRTSHHSFQWRSLFISLISFVFLFLISINLYEHFCETPIFGICNRKNLSASCLRIICCWKWTCRLVTILSHLRVRMFLIQGSV